MSTIQNWEERCLEKKKRQKESIPKEWLLPHLPVKTHPNVLDLPEKCGLLSTRELSITETTDVDTILAKLSASEWSSLEVTLAFYKRAVIAHQSTNCLTEIFVEQALERAAELDEILANTGKAVGPLHGLPISLKDQFTMKGLETTMGYVAGIGTYSKNDCVIVQILYECGAVPFVRTNLPQTIWPAETFNHVFGRTLNPYNRMLTPGGSSGGEGALIAMKGSPLGVGTDIGGSIRIPAAFCGLYALRPSYERLPYYGAANSLRGQESISSVLGPMSNSLSGIKTFMTAVIGAQPWKLDPVAIRKPWNEDEWSLSEHGGVQGRLCFAIMWDNGVVKPHPPLKRALRLVKEALERCGHEVIDWENHRHLEIYRNSETIIAADGGHDFRVECAKSGEPLITTMAPTEAEEVGEGYIHQPPVSHAKTFTQDQGHLSAYELWKLHDEKRDLRKSHLDHWAKTVSRTGTGRPVDAIIAPVASSPACPHGMNTDSFYTMLCNSLDYTCSSFPVTVVDPAVDRPVEPHDFYNDEDEAIYRLYDTDIFAGCPVGLQLIGQTLEEEAVLRMTYIVADALEKLNQEYSK